MTAVMVVLGAAIAAPLRYALSRALDGSFPTGMLLVNVVGSGLFGAFAAMSLGDTTWALLGTGFCGGFTSFSTFAVQTVERPARAAAAYVVTTTLLCVGACAVGWGLVGVVG